MSGQGDTAFRAITGTPEKVSREITRLYNAQRIVVTPDGQPVQTMAVDETGQRVVVLALCVQSGAA